jgi:hypothetical protein
MGRSGETGVLEKFAAIGRFEQTFGAVKKP